MIVSARVDSHWILIDGTVLEKSMGSISIEILERVVSKVCGAVMVAGLVGLVLLVVGFVLVRVD